MEGGTDFCMLGNDTLTAPRYRDEILGHVVRHACKHMGPYKLLSTILS